MSATVIVYNQGGQERLGRVSLNHAITMIHKGKARIIEAVAGEYFGPYERPTAIELIKYVFAKWKYNRTGILPFSKRGVLRRDGFVCAYCGGRASTVDHILPKSRGNPASWENSVAACQPCNNRKANRTPEEAHMKLNFQPYRPTFENAYRWARPEDDWR